MAKREDILLTIAVERIVELQEEIEALQHQVRDLEADLEYWNEKANRENKKEGE